MDSNVLVSVLVITYNHRNFIRRCLDSIISQNTDFRFEIIVHDDVSTDGTREIVQEYAEKYPELLIPILQEENQYSQGIDFIHSYMVPLASGKYFILFEGDDFFSDPDKLKLQAEALEAHPECSACVHDTDTVDIKGDPQTMHFPDIKIDHSLISTEEFMRLVLSEGHWLFHLSSLMVPADLFREYMVFRGDGYPSLFYQVGDLPMFLYYSLKGTLYYIDRVLSVYTSDSGGFMSRVKKDPAFALRVHQGYIDGLKEFDKYSQYRFHDNVTAALVERRFEVDRISRRFDRIVKHPEYRSLVRQRGIFKAAAFYLIGYIMLLFRRKNNKSNSLRRKGEKGK